MLPVLAEAGVVDAGGTGFLLLLDAALTVVDGRPLPEPVEVAAPTVVVHSTIEDAHESVSELRYEVMYFLEAPDETVPAFKDVWAGIGDSIVVVGGDGIWNCHIHTDDIGAAIEAAIDCGRPRNIRVTDLLEHLRHLLLVQHMGHVPDSLPLTEESRDRLREQANQLPEPTVVRLVDLLAVVIEDERQGGDPRLPLELALVKVTRPQADLARESLVHRVEVLESRVHAGPPAAESWGPSPVPAPAAGPAPADEQPRQAEPLSYGLTFDQVHDAWTRSVLPAVKERSIPVASLLAEASPSSLEDDTLTLSFKQSADFHRGLVEEPKNLTVVRDALYEVTGRRLAIVTTVGDDAPDDQDGDEEPAGEQTLIALLKTDLDATEVEETS